VRIVRPETTPGDYFAAGERCLRNFYRRHYPFDADETVALEERVTFALDDEGSYRIQGVIDRLVRTRDGRLEIHDYKTSRRIPPQRVLDQDRQLGLYELGVRGRFPEAEEIRLVWHYLHGNEMRSSTRSPQQLSALREETMELIDRIRSEEEFAPRPSPLCGWCEYRELCPAGGAQTEPPAPETRPGTPPAAAAPLATTERGQLSLL
jgi:putative RecB family exonuclease